MKSHWEVVRTSINPGGPSQSIKLFRTRFFAKWYADDCNLWTGYNPYKVCKVKR